MQTSSNTPPVTPTFDSEWVEQERRSRFRGHPQFDLCNLLESFRRRETLSAVALSDAEGIIVAGAGSYTQCQELGARAAAEQSGAEVVIGGQQLLLAVSDENAELGCPAPAARGEISAACERILGRHPRKPPLGLLG